MAADNRSRQARLRLADEKDGLADRVDTLIRALEELRDDEPVRAARRELERAAVGQRDAGGCRWSPSLVQEHPPAGTISRPARSRWGR